MSTSDNSFINYLRLRKNLSTHSLLLSEVPAEHFVSLPLPTKRWVKPAYACFASSVIRKQHQPTQQGVPTRWWLIDASHGRLILYALWNVLPYAQDVQWTSVMLPMVDGQMAVNETNTIESLMDILAPSFFIGQSGDSPLRKTLAQILQSYLPNPIYPQYRALTPDFFAWLES